MIDYLERLRETIAKMRAGKYSGTGTKYGTLLTSDLEALLGERDTLASALTQSVKNANALAAENVKLRALVEEAETCLSAVMPFLLGMSKNKDAKFNEATREWMTRRGEEYDALLTKLRNKTNEA